MEAIQYGGAIFHEDERDYLLGGSNYGSIIDFEKLPSIKTSLHELNQLEFQKDFGRNLCTVYAPLGMLSNNVSFSIDENTRKKVAEKRYTANDFNPEIGGYLDQGNFIVNDYFKLGIVYRINKQIIPNLNGKGYSVNIGMYVGGDVNKADDDGKFTNEEIEKIVNAKSGHSTLLVSNIWQDSYKGVKNPNITKIEDINKFINSWFVYQNAYVIIPNFVIRDYFINLLKGKNQLFGQEYYKKIEAKLYPREKQIFQYVMQKLYMGKINTEELKQLKF